MICKNCGAENLDQDLFCKSCGTSLSAAEQPNQQSQQTYQQPNYQQPNYQQPSYQQPAYQQPSYQQPQVDNTPISMWGYFGYQLLFAIPCVGLICLLVFSFGGAKNINVRNFARSYFCFLIIVAVLFAIIIATGGIGSIYGPLFNSFY